jgi:hypothetical protein
MPVLAGQVGEVSGQGGSLGVPQQADAAPVMQAGCQFWCSHSDESPASGAAHGELTGQLTGNTNAAPV